MDVKVEVRGLRELNAAFRGMDKELNRQLRRSFLEIARMVATRASSKVPRGPSGKAARSIRPRATQKGAGVTKGDANTPYYPWLDFGGSVGKGHRPRIPWSGSVKRDAPKGGRYIYPTIAESTTEIREAVVDAIERAADTAGFETKAGL